MPLPQIAVEIVVPDAPRGKSQRKNPVESSELRRTLLQACSDTVQVATCVNADSAHGAVALALVFWKGAAHVRIEVGSKEAPGGQTWTSREIDFAPGDALAERWRAAGYAAGTLASLLVHARAKTGTPAQPGEGRASSGSSDAPPATSATPTMEPHASASEPKPEPAPTHERTPAASPVDVRPAASDVGVAHSTGKQQPRRQSWTWAIDAALSVGPGIAGIGAAPRIGGFARVSRAFGGPMVTASLGYSEEKTAPTNLSARWITPALGVGYRAFVGAGFSLEARAEVVAEYLDAIAEDPSTGERGSASRWLAGGRAGASVAWSPFDPVALVVGGAAEARGPATDLKEHGTVVATTPLFTCALEAGLRVVTH